MRPQIRNSVPFRKYRGWKNDLRDAVNANNEFDISEKERTIRKLEKAFPTEHRAMKWEDRSTEYGSSFHILCDCGADLGNQTAEGALFRYREHLISQPRLLDVGFRRPLRRITWEEE